MVIYEALLESIIVLGLIYWCWRVTNGIIKLENRVNTLAMRIADLDTRVNDIDDSTGIAIHELDLKIETFNKLYGEAVIEEKREAARAEKAWADGVNNIMSFGAGLHERGDGT